MAGYTDYWSGISKSTPGSGSSGYNAGADVLFSSPFDSGYYGANPINTTQNADQGTRAHIGTDGLAYVGGSNQRFTGKDAASGKTYKDGVEQQLVPGTADTFINPNDPSARYKPVSITKDPAVASAADDLLATFKKNTDASLQDFSSYLNNFKTDLSGARDKTAAATDITAPVASLRADQAKYAGALNTASAGSDAAIADNAAKEQAILGKYQDTIPQYDVASQNTADRAQAAAVQALSKYKLGTGTPTSLGSNEERILARNVADIQLPTQLAKIKAQQDFYSGLALPVQRELYGNTQTGVRFNADNAAKEFASGQATEQTIQGLKQTVANMSTTAAIQFMQALRVPAEIQQAILSAQTQQLGQIAQVKAGNQYQGLQDVLGANLTQPQYFSQSQPGQPSYRPTTSSPVGYSPAGSPTVTGTPGNTGNSPMTVNPNQYPIIDPNTGGYRYVPLGETQTVMT